MPGTRAERIFAILGLVAVALLGILTTAAWLDYREEPPPTAPATAGTETSQREAAPAPQPIDVERTPEPVREVIQSAARTKLVLTAARGESWVAVRNGSAEGQSLFEAVLARGQTLRYTRSRLWIRVGAPTNLDATLNGNAVQLPDGTASVIATGDRITVVETG